MSHFASRWKLVLPVALALIMVCGGTTTAAQAAPATRPDIVIAINDEEEIVVEVSAASMQAAQQEVAAGGDLSNTGSKSFAHTFSRTTSKAIYNAVKYGSVATLVHLCMLIPTPGLPTALKLPVCTTIANWMVDRRVPALGENDCYKLSGTVSWRWVPPRLSVRIKLEVVNCKK